MENKSYTSGAYTSGQTTILNVVLRYTKILTNFAIKGFMQKFSANEGYRLTTSNGIPSYSFLTEPSC